MVNDRFPLLTPAGAAMLERLREHPHAPHYRAECGNRLTAEDLEELRQFEHVLRQTPIGWPQGERPEWLDAYVNHACQQVPAYRRYDRAVDFESLPTIERADLSRAIWNFVPDDQPLERLIVHKTSGTSGQMLRIPTHPVVSSGSFPLLKVALERYGVHLTSGAGQVGAVLVGWQRKAFTYPSVTPLWDDAGHLKLNLHVDDWRDPDDRTRFLDDLNPEVYTGDPLAFEILAGLPLTTRPKALVSTATTLLPALRAQLESRFGCPVIDLFSMNECNGIAMWHDGAFELIQPRLYIEILDPHGQPVPDGELGEVTLTGGYNRWLPLVRYRTNDFARRVWRQGQPVLTDLEGRRPVLFTAVSGDTLSSLDITFVLKHQPLTQFALHQHADGALTFRYSGPSIDPESLRAALLGLFGPDQPLTLEPVDTLGRRGEKVLQYTRDWS
jgi:phenylacetate-CoA ligase